ncbi:MAG: hypothetical protein IPJ82_23900 [Lewinellaceae bacterium]|nr:hypothetical protein [Lewinellaceae bacterium]
MRVVFILLLFAHRAFSQSDPAIPAEKIFEPADVNTLPQFPGGEKELLLFLSKNMQAPAVQDPGGFPGKTVATFVVNKDGGVSDIEIVRGAGIYGDELKRVLGAMPPWAPATLNGVPVRVRMTLPVHPHPDQSEAQPKSGAVIRLIDSALVWEGVRIKTEEIFEEVAVGPSFKVKKNKNKRRALAEALEAQFQINMSADDVRSIKRAGDLAGYIFRAQKGLVMFSKTGFQGKVERLITNRKTCDENGDCLNYVGAMIVPKGMVVTFFNQPKFKGEQMIIDASSEEVRIPSFFNLKFEGPVKTTSKTVNWREDIQSVRFLK